MRISGLGETNVGSDAEVTRWRRRRHRRRLDARNGWIHIPVRPGMGQKSSRKRWSKATTTRKDARWEEEEKENSGDRVATLGRVTYKR